MLANCKQVSCSKTAIYNICHTGNEFCILQLDPPMVYTTLHCTTMIDQLN